MLPSLAVVDGTVTISHNRRLTGDPLPRLREAQRVDVAFNDDLDGTVVDRLLGVYRR